MLLRNRRQQIQRLCSPQLHTLSPLWMDKLRNKFRPTLHLCYLYLCSEYPDTSSHLAVLPHSIFRRMTLVNLKESTYRWTALLQWSTAFKWILPVECLKVYHWRQLKELSLLTIPYLRGIFLNFHERFIVLFMCISTEKVIMPLSFP